MASRSEDSQYGGVLTGNLVGCYAGSNPNSGASNEQVRYYYPAHGQERREH